MAKSRVSNIRKKKHIGRPPVGAIPVLVRIPPADMKPIDDWISEQTKFISRPEAIRRLVELGLTLKHNRKQAPAAGAVRAKELAGAAIDKMADGGATADDQASRKRRLLKGPEEFREARVDRPKAKRK
jgi:hypothetical protein